MTTTVVIPADGAPQIVDLAFANSVNWRWSFELSYDGQPFQLGEYLMRMQVRETAAATSVAIELSSAVDNGLLRITDAAAGKFEISVPHTKAATVAAGEYVYDIVLSAGGSYRRALRGRVTVEQGVTR